MTLERSSRNRAKAPLLPIALLAAVFLVLIGVLGYLIVSRLEKLEVQVSDLGRRVGDTARQSETAAARAAEAEQRAVAAEEAAVLAARGRAQAEAKAATAEHEAERAREKARLARAQAERVRKEAEEELERLHKALSQIAETRRTALGLVMNLGGDVLKFDFDKAALRSENRELLSRIAGILLTSKDYLINVNGHTDDIGSDSYNQKLSERRAQAVRDYLVQAGIDPDIITTKGFGKAEPLVSGMTPEARAKNRRVEIGIVNTRIQYMRPAAERR
ncbi:MAG: OmpA family protein [Acidobacteriota bacterium]